MIILHISCLDSPYLHPFPLGTSGQHPPPSSQFPSYPHLLFHHQCQQANVNIFLNFWYSFPPLSQRYVAQGPRYVDGKRKC